MPGLGTSFGRGGATTAQQDLARADAILIMGSNMAENHPVGFQWVMEAREKNGAKIIHVDPRFTRTSAMADIWVPLRSGTDILFIGAVINYILSNDRWFKEYVLNYTNAPFIVNEGVKDTEDLGGVFSGWDQEHRKYDPTSWLYEDEPIRDQGSAALAESAGGHGLRDDEAGSSNIYKMDMSLQHPRCVFQLLKRHYARYTPEMVEEHCGVPKDVFLNVAETFVSASGPEKTGAICYAVGWTQHSKGVQVIRTAAILQMLLGNIGRPGGGILALRGHASIQGSTDIPTLYDLLPGYLPMPFAENSTDNWENYVKKHKTQTGLWSNFEKYIVSLLRAYYGNAISKQNNWGFDWLPRVTGDQSAFGFTMAAADGKMEGMFIMGENPVVGSPNGGLQRKALSKLKWLVVREMVETESASFWKESPEIERGEISPEEIGTEVFLLPAAGQAEKSGCFTNTQRLIQFHNKAVEPPGDARSETWFIYHLGRRMKAKAAESTLARDLPLQSLEWSYSTHGPTAEPDVEQVLQEINGCTWPDRKLVKSYKELKADGSTACGCWIYSGIYPEPGLNRANQRASRDYLGHGWGFSWPNDCRVIYNRASARPDGRPWSERKKLVWWDEGKGEWTGMDRPDFELNKRPDDPGDLRNGTGTEALPGNKPFVLHPDGTAWIWVNSLKDGPLPSHYEPLESLFRNPMYPEVQTNPVAMTFEGPDNPYAKQPGDPRFPYLLTTYRLTEHHTAGGMSRTLTHLSELQPELFCEVSPELAELAGLKHGDYATIVTMRSLIEARVLVTPRLHPLIVNGERVYLVGLPYHFGFKGLATGDMPNDLLAVSEEPNVRIMETKALVCNIVPGRRARGRAAKDELEAQRNRAA